MLAIYNKNKGITSTNQKSKFILPGQHEISVLEHVDQPTRRGDDNLAAQPQLEALLLTRQTADNRPGANPQRLAKLVGLLLDLLGQLTGGRHDNGVGALVRHADDVPVGQA